MLDFLITAIKFIFLLGFLVLIHEGGHFLVAKSLQDVKDYIYEKGLYDRLIWEEKQDLEISHIVIQDVYNLNVNEIYIFGSHLQNFFQSQVLI